MIVSRRIVRTSTPLGVTTPKVNPGVKHPRYLPKLCERRQEKAGEYRFCSKPWQELLIEFVEPPGNRTYQRVRFGLRIHLGF